jgi:hypothetical protein
MDRCGERRTLTLTRLEVTFGARELGRLVEPGSFFDFTRYRPVMYLKEGIREVTIPNSFITYAQREGENDLIFLHLLEPHMMAELYVSSVLQVLKKLNIQRYCLLGSMYDMVPHTRPLLVTGNATGKQVEKELQE